MRRQKEWKGSHDGQTSRQVVRDVKRQKYRRTVQTIERKKNKQAGRQIYP